MYIRDSFWAGVLIAGTGTACGGRVQDNDPPSSTRDTTGGRTFKSSLTGGGMTLEHSSIPRGSVAGIGGSETGGTIGNVALAGSSAEIGGTTFIRMSGTGGSTTNNNLIINDFSSASDTAAFSLSRFVCDSCYTNAATGIRGTTVSFGWVSDVDADANAAPGSLVVNAVFTDWNQLIDVQMPVPLNASGIPIDLEHQRLTAKIMVARGLSRLQDYPFGAALYVRTGKNEVLGASYWTAFDTLGKWYTLTMVDDSETWWASHPSNDTPHFLGLKFGTGPADERSYCPVIFREPFGSPLETVFYLDRILVEQ